jgi:hypothetical protein
VPCITQRPNAMIWRSCSGGSGRTRDGKQRELKKTRKATKVHCFL